MRAHFLLGPAGSGKTWRCLEEIRHELKAAPGGPPLVLLAPKQATFQLERQLLESADLAGYSRLQIVSFDRLAHWLLETFATVPELLDDEGRVMVLRALLAREQPALRVFRATARLAGFARQLSQLLREFQRHQLTPARLARLADRVTGSGSLRDKLHDLHHLLRAYHAWLAENGIEDGDQLLDLATAFLRATPSPLPMNQVGPSLCAAASVHLETEALPSKALPSSRAEIADLGSWVLSRSSSPISGLWLDGFAEMTPQELDLLCAVLPFCRSATLAFCLDETAAAPSQSWLSLWSVVRRTYVACRQRVESLAGCKVTVEELARDPARSRFAARPELAALEANWSAPAAVLPHPAGEGRGEGENVRPPIASSPPPHLPSPIFPPLRAAVCANPEAEAAFAAREILRHVQAGGRFRDCAVILRTLDLHHAALRRTFTRYGIPFFLDRREPVAHHPLAELTRFTLRTLAYGWQPEDFFGALKTGLVHDRDADIDWLENIALAHGWRGAQWLAPLQVPDAKFHLTRAEHLRAQLTAPLQNLAAQLTPGSSRREEAPAEHGTWNTEHGTESQSLVTAAVIGAQLAAALRTFWETLGIETRLQAWDDALAREENSPLSRSLSPSLHGTVLRQMHAWLENLERAFPDADAEASEARRARPGRAAAAVGVRTPCDAVASSAALSLREWLPILEAGLSTLTVGVIPAALDQVLIGTIDRSRNPELRLALILGLNEGVFPAPPAPPVLLTEAEREILALHDTRLGLDARAQLAHERYFAYIACTRSRARLVLTCAAASADGDPLHPSPILTHVQRLRPDLALEPIPLAPPPAAAVHAEDLLAPLLQELAGEGGREASAAAQAAALPHPGPLPLGEGIAKSAPGVPLAIVPSPAADTRSPARPMSLPLPAGEGRGEGENVRSPNAPSTPTHSSAPSASSPSPPPGERVGVRGQMPLAPTCSQVQSPILPSPPQSLSLGGGEGGSPSSLLSLGVHPVFSPLLARFREISAARTSAHLSPAAVAQLYGTHLASSVSKLEQFAECPFKFFIAAGLGAEERKEFEVDHRERGSFIHRLLDEFHTRVTAAGDRWRDLSPATAADLAARLGEELLASPEFALFAADEPRRFAARTLIASAQRLLAALVDWMPTYTFDPAAVELAFGLGPDAAWPAWRLALAEGKSLALRGRIDRVDLHRDTATGRTFAVIVDYKSSPKKLDPLKVANGLQLQLLAYLHILQNQGDRRWETGDGAEHTPRQAAPNAPEATPHRFSPLAHPLPLHPVGVFYIPLHGSGGGTGGRAEILAEDAAARRAIYQHAGRFDFEHRALLDSRPGDQPSGQFRYALNKDRSLSKRGGDALPSADFTALLAQVEANLRRLGDAIFAGEVAVNPVRLSATDTACARCEYRPICRFDPWTQPYRALVKPAGKEEET